MPRRNELDEAIEQYSDPYFADDDRGHRQYTLDRHLLEPLFPKVYPNPAHRPPRARRAPQGQLVLPGAVANDRQGPLELPEWPDALPAPKEKRFIAYRAQPGRYELLDRVYGHTAPGPDAVADTEHEGDMAAAQAEQKWLALRAVLLGCRYRAVRLWYVERMELGAVLRLEQPSLAVWALNPPPARPLPPAGPAPVRIGRRDDPAVVPGLEIKKTAIAKLTELLELQLRLAAQWFEAQRSREAIVALQHVEALQWAIGHHDPAWWERCGIDLIDPTPPPLRAVAVYCERVLTLFAMTSHEMLPR